MLVYIVSEGSLWEKLRATGVEHKITGILNPANGPNVDQTGNPDDYPIYQNIVHDFLCKGTRATEPAEAEALMAPTEEATEEATEEPTTASPTGAPADGSPTDGSPQRALQTDCPEFLTVRNFLLCIG